MSQSDAELLARLRAGGFTLLLRHGASDSSQVDRDPIDLSDCATQRNLSAKGQDQATAIGAAIATLSIPIGRVFSSPYCRAAETARLAFGRAELLDELVLSESNDRGRDEGLRQRLADPADVGTNTVLVTHLPNIVHATGLRSKPGEAMIFAARKRKRFKLVARVEAGHWTELARDNVG